MKTGNDGRRSQEALLWFAKMNRQRRPLCKIPRKLIASPGLGNSLISPVLVLEQPPNGREGGFGGLLSHTVRGLFSLGQKERKMPGE